MKAALVSCLVTGLLLSTGSLQAQQARRVDVDLLPEAATTLKVDGKGPNSPVVTAAAGRLQIKLPATVDDYAWFEGPELPLAPGSAWRLRFTVAAGPDMLPDKAVFGVGYVSRWGRQIMSTLQPGLGHIAIRQYDQGKQDPMMARNAQYIVKKGPGEANTIELVQRDGGIEMSVNGQFVERSNPLDVPPHRLRLVGSGGTWTLSELRFETLGPDTRWSRLRLESMGDGQKVRAKGLRQQVSKDEFDKGGIASWPADIDTAVARLARQGSGLRFEQKLAGDAYVGPDWQLPLPRMGRHVSLKLADITRKEGSDDCVGLFVQSFLANKGAVLACLTTSHAILFHLTEQSEWKQLSRAPLPASFNPKAGGWLSLASTRQSLVMLLDGLPMGQADRPLGFQDGRSNVYLAGQGTAVTVQDFQAAEL